VGDNTFKGFFSEHLESNIEDLMKVIRFFPRKIGEGMNANLEDGVLKEELK
jgi:hypothetical protein